MTSRKGFSRKTVDDKIKRDPQYAKRFREIISETIGGGLRDARQNAGLSQKIVAERMGVSESRVTQIEGEAGASLSLRSLRRYASAVGCRLNIELVDVARNITVSTILVGDDRVDETAHSVTEAATHGANMAAGSKLSSEVPRP